jgi:hypothetical protein
MSNKRVVTKKGLLVRSLEIDENGQLKKKVMELERDSQLENTLLEALYPGIQVATVDVPRQQLDSYQQARVEQTLAQLSCDGVPFRLIGASGSAKSGKYYAVDTAHERAIADRFRNWPEAAMVYFGILVSPCSLGRMELPNARVMVVADHDLGTNDCRGWLRRSIFERLQLPDRRFYQFRLAFGPTQAKGSFKVMDDEVADALSTDIIVPKSSVKPECKGPSVLRQVLCGLKGIDARTFEGPVVLGIREMSRPLDFRSSYTLAQHAPMESIELEIIPAALESVRKITDAARDNNFEELLRLLGTSESQRVLDDTDSAAPDDGAADGEYTSEENTIIEAVLKADPTGFFLKHPHVNTHLQRRFAKWAYKVCTAGGFTLPAFALADDGYLFLHDGQIWSGSDWMPEDHGVAALGCDRMLLVRYPIRTREDLLPIHNLHSSAAADLLAGHLHSEGCSLSSAEVLDRVFVTQLALEGTITIHADTAKKNGGDYDFDWVSCVDQTRFPRFVADRFAMSASASNQKNKLQKKQSPWWNLPQVAMKAKGNSIGRITDLITSCLAEGRNDLAERLALELQASLDSLKHGVEPDEDVIREVRKQVTPAPWLKCKRARRVSDLPLTVESARTDRIGALYNIIRKEIDEFFTDVLPLDAFRGVIVTDEVVTREMHDEAELVYRIYWKNIQRMTEIKAGYAESLDKAQKALESAPKDAANRKQLTAERNKAQAALYFYEERQHKELKALISFVRKWAEQKHENRLGYLQALYEIVCRGKGQGSIVFYAFPQELVNQIVERTGGRPVTVAIPELVDGEIEIDPEGRVFLVDQVAQSDGTPVERHIFLMQVTEDGRVLMDYGPNGQAVEQKRIQPFRFQPGRSELRDGKVLFPGTQQRPHIPPAQAYR